MSIAFAKSRRNAAGGDSRGRRARYQLFPGFKCSSVRKWVNTRGQIAARGGDKLNRRLLTGILVAALATIIVVRIVRHRNPTGFAVRAVTTQCGSPEQLLERPVRLRLKEDGNLYIDADPLTAENLRMLLVDIFKTRTEKMLFVDAAHSVPYQRVIDVIDATGAAVPDMQIILITDATRQKCEGLWMPTPAF